MVFLVDFFFQFFLDKPIKLHVSLINIPPQLWLECTSFKIWYWNVPDNGDGRSSCYHIAIRLDCNL